MILSSYTDSMFRAKIVLIWCNWAELLWFNYEPSVSIALTEYTRSPHRPGNHGFDRVHSIPARAGLCHLEQAFV